MSEVVGSQVSPTLTVFRCAATVLPRLPRPVVVAVATVAGWVAWLWHREGRRAVRANLRVVLGAEPSRQQVRAVFVTAARNYADLLALPGLSDGELERCIDVVGWEHLDAALAAGRGALLASLHLGNIEVVGRAATLKGYAVLLPVERIEPPELLELMLRLRRRAGLRCEPVGERAFAAVREALQRKAIVGIGADRLTLGRGEVVRFCGRPARLPIAAALLALRTGAPLLPVASQRLPGQRFRVRLGAPLPVVRTGRLRADAVALTERLFAELAVFLRDNPTQWVVFRSVWTAECPDSR